MLSLEKQIEQFWLEKTFKMIKSNSGIINNIILLVVFSVSCKTMRAAKPWELQASQIWMGLSNITRRDIKLKFMPYFNSPHISTLFTRFLLDKIHTEKAVTVIHLSWSLLVFSSKCLIFLRIISWFTFLWIAYFKVSLSAICVTGMHQLWFYY